MWHVASEQRPCNLCPFITTPEPRRCSVSLSRECPNIFSNVLVHIKRYDEVYTGYHKPTAIFLLYLGSGPVVQAQKEFSFLFLPVLKFLFFILHLFLLFFSLNSLTKPMTNNLNMNLFNMLKQNITTATCFYNAGECTC